jgi:hypothetical protein
LSRNGIGTANILMVGIHEGYVRTLSADRAYTPYLLEEPEIFGRMPNQLGLDSDHVLLSRYQQSDEFLESAIGWHERVGFDGVVPALEYGVYASGRLARACGLPYVGWTATRACTDKGYLRGRVEGTGILQPRWRLIGDLAELTDFYDDRPFVLKPTNGRASEGVKRVSREDEIAQAWAEVQGFDGSRGYASAGRDYRYLAEDLVAGVQVSVETLYRSGEPIFDNVCLMQTGFGDYFPIMSVTVPAPIAAADYEASIAASHRLGHHLSVEHGFIHSEWKLVDGSPYLIECAARVPGAFTPELAMRAYGGFDMYDAQLRVLSGMALRATAPPPQRVATVQWLRIPPGTVQAVSGTDFLRDHPSIFASKVKLRVGDVVPVMRSGWDRVGYFACEAGSWPEVQEVVAEALRNVDIRVDGTDCRPHANE